MQNIYQIRRVPADSPDVDLLKVFADLRLSLEERGLMQYRENSENPERSDQLYIATLKAEGILRDRLGRN